MFGLPPPRHISTLPAAEILYLSVNFSFAPASRRSVSPFGRSLSVNCRHLADLPKPTQPNLAVIGTWLTANAHNVINDANTLQASTSGKHEAGRVGLARRLSQQPRHPLEAAVPSTLMRRPKR